MLRLNAQEDGTAGSADTFEDFFAATNPRLFTALWLVTGEGLLVLLGLAGAARAFGPGAERPDQGALAQFVFLLVALSALTLIPVPGLPGR